MRTAYGLGALLGLGLYSVAGPALSQASIAAENIVDIVTFSYVDAVGAKQDADVTLVRDELQTDQWYYVPSKPQLVTTRVGDKVVPEFTLVSYDYPDPTNPQTILRAGLLNFSARLSLPPEALGPLKAAAQATLSGRLGPGAGERMRIAALPINSATVSVYSSNNALVGSSEGTGTAPTFASQTMAFSMPLTQLGTAVFDELVKSPAGVRTAVLFTYNGMTPKCGYKVTVDYEQAQQHYSRNEKFAARASYFGWFSANATKETTDIRESLENAGVLKIEKLVTNQCTSEQLDTLMQPILKRINDQVLDTFKPPEKIDPAHAGTPRSGGYFGGAGYSVSVKKVRRDKTQKETINFEQTTVVERTTVAQGGIGVANYPDDIKAGSVVTVNGLLNPGVYVSFPTVPAGVDRVNLDLTLEADGKSFGTGQYEYLRSANTWKNVQTGKTADRMSFSLAGVQQALGKPALDRAQLRVSKVVEARKDDTTALSTAPVGQGSAAVRLRDGLVGVQLSPSGVTFKEMDGVIQRVHVLAKSEGKAVSYLFRPFQVNGVWRMPDDEFFFAPKKGAPVELTVTTYKTNGDGPVKRTQTVTADGMLDVALVELVKPE